MLGFVARAVSSDIVLDNQELANAGWFSADELSQFGEWADDGDGLKLPRIDSIARYLIDSWVAGNSVMNSRHNSDQQKYKDAGEQAAHVIGEFMSIANDFSRRFGGGFPEPGPANEESHKSYRGSHDADSTSDDRATYNAAEGIQQAGEYLRELREAAGYSIDGFAQAMNRQNAATKIESVEAGRDVFPKDWLEQISALLKQK